MTIKRFRFVAALLVLCALCAAFALAQDTIDEYGLYTDAEDVALYLDAYGCLPCNYISRDDALSLGWKQGKNDLSDVAPGYSLGGDRFENREGLLPEADGRVYYSCDIEYTSGVRTSKRLVYSNDGLYYLTENAYQSFTPLLDTAPIAVLPEDGLYTARDDVALYLHLYGHLPDNFITKNEAREMGWDSSRNYVGEAAPGKSIGGDRFGNYEGTLPDKKGRTWTECDIGYTGTTRGAARIVFSNDGLIYYTEDHYETFTLLYTQDGAQELYDEEDEAA